MCIRDRRKAERRLFSFDDQLTRLDQALSDPATGAQARARLAARFPVVLVDEFQDTDPTQWSVLRQALCLGQGTDRQLTFDQRMLLWQLLSGVFAERQERLACRVSPDGGRVILDRRLFERPPPDRLLKRTAWQSSTVVLPWDADGNGEPRAFGILTTENL